MVRACLVDLRALMAYSRALTAYLVGLRALVAYSGALMATFQALARLPSQEECNFEVCTGDCLEWLQWKAKDSALQQKAWPPSPAVLALQMQGSLLASLMKLHRASRHHLHLPTQ